MNINLTDPNWIAVIIAVAAAITAVTHFVTKALLGRNVTEGEHTLTEDQLIVVLQIHQNSVASEVSRRMSAYFYKAEIMHREVTEEDFEELKKEMVAVLKERRELLRAFKVSKGRLNEVAALNYDAQVDKDFDRLKKIGLSKELSSFEKAERIQEAIRQIQVNLRAGMGLALKS